MALFFMCVFLSFLSFLNFEKKNFVIIETYVIIRKIPTGYLVFIVEPQVGAVCKYTWGVSKSLCFASNLVNYKADYETLACLQQSKVTFDISIKLEKQLPVIAFQIICMILAGLLNASTPDSFYSKVKVFATDAYPPSGGLYGTTNFYRHIRPFMLRLIQSDSDFLVAFCAEMPVFDMSKSKKLKGL